MSDFLQSGETMDKKPIASSVNRTNGRDSMQWRNSTDFDKGTHPSSCRQGVESRDIPGGLLSDSLSLKQGKKSTAEKRNRHMRIRTMFNTPGRPVTTDHEPSIFASNYSQRIHTEQTIDDEAYDPALAEQLRFKIRISKRANSKKISNVIERQRQTARKRRIIGLMH